MRVRAKPLTVFGLAIIIFSGVFGLGGIVFPKFFPNLKFNGVVVTNQTPTPQP